MVEPVLRGPAGSRQNDPIPSTLPVPGPPSPKNCCSASAYGTRSSPPPAARPPAPAATDRSQTLRDLATGYARRSPPGHPASRPSPSSAVAQSGNPEPERSALPVRSFPAARNRQTFGSLADTSASLPDETLAACVRYGRAATTLRSRSLRSSL